MPSPSTDNPQGLKDSTLLGMARSTRACLDCRDMSRQLCKRCAAPAVLCECGKQINYLRTLMTNDRPLDDTANSIFAQWLMTQWGGDVYFLSHAVVWRCFLTIYTEDAEALGLDAVGNCPLDDAVRQLNAEELNFDEMIKYIRIPEFALKEVHEILADE